MSDEELLRASSSDPEAFGAFYDRNVKDVLAYFYRRTACHHTSADLTAETFAEALRGSTRFRSRRGRARAWLFGIAQHQLSHFLRRQEVSRRSLGRLGIRIESSSVDDAFTERVDSLVDSAEQVELLKSAWHQLPEGLAEAVMLRVGKGLPFEEVAQNLGCSTGAARVRVSRGLSRLAEAVND